jgi:hypothetical protein
MPNFDTVFSNINGLADAEGARSDASPTALFSLFDKAQSSSINQLKTFTGNGIFSKAAALANSMVSVFTQLPNTLSNIATTIVDYFKKSANSVSTSFSNLGGTINSGWHSFTSVAASVAASLPGL